MKIMSDWFCWNEIVIKNEVENMKRKMVKRMIMMKMSKELMKIMMMKILIRGYAGC